VPEGNGKTREKRETDKRPATCMPPKTCKTCTKHSNNANRTKARIVFDGENSEQNGKNKKARKEEKLQRRTTNYWQFSSVTPGGVFETARRVSARSHCNTRVLVLCLMMTCCALQRLGLDGIALQWLGLDGIHSLSLN
jgi:hypothetical protein